MHPIISKHDQILKQNIEKTVREIRDKVMAIRRNEQDAREVFQKSYEPIIEPVKEMLSHIKQEKKQHNNYFNDFEKSKIQSSPKLTKQKTYSEKEHKNILETQTSSNNQTPNNYRKVIPKKILDTNVGFLADDDDVFLTTIDNEKSANSSPTFEELREEVKKVENVNAKAYQEYLDSYHTLTAEYIDKYYRDTEDAPRDKENGVQLNVDTEKWTLGDKEVKFLDNSDIKIGDKIYNGTRGLYELLFMQNPITLNIKNVDRVAYKKIRESTNLDKKNTSTGDSSNSSGSSSATKFVLPKNVRDQSRRRYNSDPHIMRLRDRSMTNKTKKTGGRISKANVGINFKNMLKTHNNNKKDYVFYDSYNELVDRLKKLISAKVAGNTSVDNEIVSIVEELREAYIIE